MKMIITVFGLLFSFLTYGQADTDTIKVIAKRISNGEGSEILIAKYQVIKIVKGNITNDTIQVGYYIHNEFKNEPDTVLLTLSTYTGTLIIKDFYIFPNYNARDGIEKVKILTVDFVNWEGCERGKCKPLNFMRKSKNENLFLLIPCDGFASTVTLSKQQEISKNSDVIQKNGIMHSTCPRIFDLTNLIDGKYYAHLITCGLGGQIEINIKTEKNE